MSRDIVINDPGNQESGNDKENVDANKSSRNIEKISMVKKYCKNGNGANSVYLCPPTAIFAE